MATSKNGNSKQKDDRLKSLDIAVGQIEKQHGNGTIMRLGDGPTNEVPSISTGSILINHALGVNGIPRGRVTEIYGPESSGKTTLAMHVIAEIGRASCRGRGSGWGGEVAHRE